MHYFLSVFKVKTLGFSCLVLLSLIFGCVENNKESNDTDENSLSIKESEVTKAWPKPDSLVNNIPVFGEFQKLEPVFNFKNDTTYVVNFWATWCKPCIKELPYFKEVDSMYKDEKFKLILVSLDFPAEVESKLVPFVKKNNISSQTVVLLDGKYNDWIDKVSPDWTGAIPATFVYNRNENKLLEKSFESSKELQDDIKPFLNFN